MFAEVCLGRLAFGLWGCFLFAVGNSCVAQIAATRADGGAPVLHVSSELVLLDALVANKKTGKLEQGLTIHDFQLTEDGVPQQLKYFSQDTLPLSIVFLFDLTQTVQPELKELGGAAAEVLSHLKPEDEIAVMTFSSSAQLLQPFTTDRTLAAAAIKRAAGSKSNEATFLDEDMYEAIDQAIKSSLPGSRRVLVWFTDGTANMVNPMTRKAFGKSAPALLHTRAEASDKLMHTGVVVSALIDRSAAADARIAIEDANPLAWAMGMGARLGDVQRYAAETGGPVLNGGKKEVAANLAVLLDEIRGRYTMGYTPSTTRPPGTFCHLELKLAHETLESHPELKQETYVVRTRAGYYR